jgi:hypothetical protein
MRDLGATVFLIGFALSTFGMYIAIRRDMVRIVTATILGCIGNSVFFILYSLAKGNMFWQAIVVGPIVGIMFTALAVTIAMFFRNNPSGA